jgi:hypothetical protein
MQDVPATETCLSNLRTAMGAIPPIRIGGTTQYVFHKAQKKGKIQRQRDEKEIINYSVQI